MQAQRHRSRLISTTRGVTLIELLAVVAILGILMGVVWLAVAGRVKLGAKQAQIKADMRQVVVAVNLYRSDNDGGLPSNWPQFGYYHVTKQGAYGGGYPKQDMYDPKPPTYDVSYHTPECAQPPKAQMGFNVFRQAVALFESRPRINKIDIEHDQAVSFSPACLVSSYAEHDVRLLERDGTIHTPKSKKGYKGLGADLTGTISYQWTPDWLTEAAVIQ